MFRWRTSSLYAAAAAFLKEPRDTMPTASYRSTPLSLLSKSMQSPPTADRDENPSRLPVSNAHQLRAASKHKDRPEGYWGKRSRAPSNWPHGKPSHRKSRDLSLDSDLGEQSCSSTNTSLDSGIDVHEPSLETLSSTPTGQEPQPPTALWTYQLEIDHSSHPALQQEARATKLENALWNQYCLKACGWNLSHGLPSEWWRRKRREESIVDSEETLEEMSRHHKSRFR